MNDFVLPSVPAIVTAILGLVAPYIVAAVNRPAWSPMWKRIIAVLVTVVLTAFTLAMYFAITREALPEWPQLILLAIVVSQAAYALVLKPSAVVVEQKTEQWFHPGSSLRRDRK